MASCSQDAKMLIHLPDYHHWDHQQVAKWCFNLAVANGLVLGQLHWKATNWHLFSVLAAEHTVPLALACVHDQKMFCNLAAARREGEILNI